MDFDCKSKISISIPVYKIDMALSSRNYTPYLAPFSALVEQQLIDLFVASGQSRVKRVAIVSVLCINVGLFAEK